MDNATGLATISEACRILATCTDLSEIKEIKNKAEAVRQYLKASGESLEAQNKAAEIRLRAERRAGELLATMPNAKTGRKTLPDTTSANSLAEIGITYKQSSLWQLAATVPEDSFAKLVEACAATGRELTSSSLLKIARDLVREDVRRTYAASIDHEPIDDAADRLEDIIGMVCEWWPEDHNKTLPDALREIAERKSITVKATHSYTCPNCGGHEQATDGEGSYCKTCIDPVDAPTESQAEIDMRLLRELQEAIRPLKAIAQEMDSRDGDMRFLAGLIIPTLRDASDYIPKKLASIKNRLDWDRTHGGGCELSKDRR